MGRRARQTGGVRRKRLTRETLRIAQRKRRTAVALLAAGQLLNVTVFHRLGTTGVFYGNRFGFEVQWCRAFPYSWLEHPQYVGAILSIWGCFAIMRYPQPDWYVLPALESLYYALAARFER